jgi:RIO kinase 1
LSRNDWFDDEFDEPPSSNGWFEELYSEGLLAEVIAPVKSGKEASVFLCRAGGQAGGGLLAAKVFHPRQARNFKNDAVYKAGRVIVNSRSRRAAAKKTRFGKEVEQGFWVHQEWEALRTLHSAGADVPRPVHLGGGVILMEYLGDQDAPAPQLKDVILTGEEARPLFDRLLWNVRRMLANNLVHADLSPYNVLFLDGDLRIIDFPQAVDARTNRNARDLLDRDMENVCRHFARYGIQEDARRLSGDLWTRFLFARL